VVDNGIVFISTGLGVIPPPEPKLSYKIVSLNDKIFFVVNVSDCKYLKICIYISTYNLSLSPQIIMAALIRRLSLAPRWRVVAQV